MDPFPSPPTRRPGRWCRPWERTQLGHALRLAGRPGEAIPILRQRLRFPNQTEVVRAELAAAPADAGG